MELAIQKFRESIRTEATLKVYTINLKSFFKQIKADPEDLIKLSNSEIEDIVFGFIVHLKDRIREGSYSANSVKMALAPVKLFLEQNDKVINWKKLGRMLPKGVKQKNQLPYTAEEIKNFLECSTSKRVRAVIHFLASTGCRIGAIRDLRIGDIIPVEKGAVVTIYRDDIEEHRSCLTPEAYNTLKEYLDLRIKMYGKYDENSYLFLTNDYKSQLSVEQCSDLIKPALIKAGIFSKTGSKLVKNDKSTNHAFRKRFDTVAVNSGIHLKYIEYMLGHYERKTDRNYFKPTDEELYHAFKPMISKITLNQEEKYFEKIIKLESNLESNNQLENELSQLRLDHFRLKQDLDDRKDEEEEHRKIIRNLIDSGVLEKLKRL
jgi:integrase